MGKNPKNADRTKNNTRPSSSGRTAELLQSCSQTNVVFASQQNTFATVAGNPDNNPDVTPEFRVVLKKLKKKDITTRQKALIEFSELCSSSNKEDVIAILPYWPRIYNTFAMDPDYALRDAIQLANGAFARASDLKNTAELAKVIAQWFVSCYDTRKSVSDKADESFKENFNVAEKIVMLQTYRKEILGHIVDNLNKKQEPDEGDSRENAAIYERRVVMNLLAYSGIITSLPRQMLAETLLSNFEYYTGNYWKLLKSDSNYVKTAWFNLLLAFMKMAPIVVYENDKKTCLCLFTHLDYENNDVITKVWQCLPYCWETLPEWLNHLSFEKLLLPKLYNVLKHGGFESSYVIYRRMPAFVSYLEKSAPDRISYINEVFDHWISGMMLRIHKEQLNYTEIVGNFFKYARLVVIRNCLDHNTCMNVGYKVLQVIEKTIENSSSLPFAVTVFRNFSMLMRAWTKQKNMGKTRVYDGLLKLTWSSFYDILANIFKTERSNLIRVLTNHLVALELLYDPLSHNDLLQKEGPKDDYKEDKMTENITSATATMEGPFGEYLTKILVKLLEDYFKLITKEKENNIFINQLCMVMYLFDEKDCFNKLDSLFRQEYKDRTDESILKEWANMDGVGILGVVRLYCNLSMHSNYDATDFLNGIAEEHRGEMLLVCLDLCSEGKVGPAIKNWLEDTSYHNSLLQFTKEICTFELPEDQASKVDILKKCIKKFEFIEQSSARQYKIAMLKTIRLNLFDKMKYGDKYEEGTMPVQAIRNAAEIVYLLIKYADKPMLNGLYGPLLSDIVAEFFGVTCDVYAKVNDREDIIYKVWRTALDNMSKVDGCDMNTMYDGIMYFCAMQVATRMATYHMSTRNIEVILHHVRTLIDSAPIKRISLEQCRHSDDGPRILGGDSDEIDSIVSDEEFLTEDEPSSRFTEISAMTIETFLRAVRQTFRLLIHPGLGDAVLKAEYLTGAMTYNDALHKQHINNHDKLWKRFPPGDKVKSPEEFSMVPNFDYIDRYYNGLYFSLELLYHYICADNSSLSNLKNMNKRSKPFITTLCIAKTKKSINFMLYQYATLCGLRYHYQEMKQFGNNHSFSLKTIRSQIQFLVKYHNEVAFDQLKELVIKNAINNGMLWASALSFFIYDITDRLSSMEVYEALNEANYDFKTDRGIHCYEVLTVRDGFEWSKLSPGGHFNLERLLVAAHNISFYLKYFNEIPDVLITTANQWIDLIAKQECKMCFDEDLLVMPLHDIVEASSIIRFMQSVTNKELHLQNEENEFLMIVCISWIRSVKRTCIVEGRDIVTFMYSDNATAVCTFICEALKYFVVFQNFALSKGINNGYTRTWIELFKIEAHSFIFELWKLFVEMDPVDTVEEFLIIKTVSLTIRLHVDCCSMIEGNLDWWIRFLSTVALRSHHLEASLSAYTILAEFFGERMKSEEVFNKVKWESLHLNDSYNLIKVLVPCEKIGKPREISKNSFDFAIVRGYLLLWTVILKAYTVNNAAYREHMLVHLKEGKFVGKFLRSLTSLMPREVYCQPTDVLAKRIQELFINDFDPLTTRKWSDKTIAAWSCHLYYMTLKTFPLFSRHWFCELEGKDMTYVERITMQFVSPSLIIEELKEVTKCPQSEIFKARGYPATREILTSYKIDDITMSEKVTVSAHYPLGLCSIDEVITQRNKKYSSLGVTINLFLSRQNASISDGVMIWKKNLEKKFAGIDECYICLSVSYGTTLKLPTMSCKQCLKKFHPDCLYRWIHSSTNPACPLCRTLF